jgi:hypothetical protein
MESAYLPADPLKNSPGLGGDARDPDAEGGLVIESGSGASVPVAHRLEAEEVRDLLSKKTLDDFTAAIQKLEQR